jgi:hypothetical protein
VGVVSAPVKLRIVCAWCGEVLEEGDPGAETSHGICATCDATVEADVDDEADIDEHCRYMNAQLAFDIADRRTR